MSPLAAIEILRAATDRCSAERVDTPEVRQALKKLKARCPDRDFLDMYWEAASGEHVIGRSQSVQAAFNGICRQLGLPLWVRDA